MLACLASEALRDAIEVACSRSGSGTLDVAALADRLPPQLRQAVTAAAMSGEFADVPDPERALESIARLKQDGRDRVERDELKKKLAAARSTGDPSVVQKLNARIAELEQVRLGLKGHP